MINIKNFILITIGLISLSLGILGIVLPILPTTPFVLLSAGCFSISSPKLSEKILRNKYLGTYIENYRYNTGVPRKTKIRAIISLWIGIIISMILINNILINTILFVIASCVSIHIGTLRSK